MKRNNTRAAKPTTKPKRAPVELDAVTAKTDPKKPNHAITRLAGGASLNKKAKEINPIIAAKPIVLKKENLCKINAANQKIKKFSEEKYLSVI